jgi:hypothetical protein
MLIPCLGFKTGMKNLFVRYWERTLGFNLFLEEKLGLVKA